MKKAIGVVLVLGFLFSCGSSYRQKKFRKDYMFAVEVGSSNFARHIPFTDINDLMFLPVQIEGKTYNFLFDTGAVTMVSKELKDEISFDSIEDKTRPTIYDASGIRKKAEFSILPKLSIGGIDFENIGVNVQDLSHFKNRCLVIDGIIGANLMRKLFWKIDYKNNTISFSDQKSEIEIKDPEVIIPFNENFGGNPQSRVVLGEYNFMALWDTGYNNTIQIPDSLFFNSYKKEGAARVTGKGLAATTLYNSGNNTTNKNVALLDSLVFEDVVLKDQVIQIEPSSGPLLGNRFLKGAEEVVLDWENHQLIFKKKPDAKPERSFGFTPFQIGNVVTVVSIWDNSEAKKQGLQIGDTIVSINQQRMENLSREQWCESFWELQEADELEIKVKKAQSTERFTINRYNLFGE